MLAGRNGARGRICTCTGDVLDFMPLHCVTRANGMELQPVLPGHEFFTNEILRLLRGGIVAGMLITRSLRAAPDTAGL